MLALACSPAPRRAERAPDAPIHVELAASIARGHAILLATRDSLPGHVGATLRCTSCHLRDGRDTTALPLLAAYARYPQYRARTGHVQLIEDRINDCLERSLNGSPLAADDPAMRDIVAYLADLSRGTPVGAPPASAPPMIASGDTVAGARVYQAQCARCHGANGAGLAGAPPLWGASSFNVGAGMARRSVAAAFIRRNMPFDRPGTLTDGDARDVASYIVSRPRPDFPARAADWPDGGAPADRPDPRVVIPR